jgi:hypothetical protein
LHAISKQIGSARDLLLLGFSHGLVFYHEDGGDGFLRNRRLTFYGLRGVMSNIELFIMGLSHVKMCLVTQRFYRAGWHSGNAIHLYSGRARFESQSRHRLSSVRFSEVLLAPHRQMPDSTWIQSRELPRRSSPIPQSSLVAAARRQGATSASVSEDISRSCN